MKKICCICSKDMTSNTENLLSLVRDYTKVNIILMSSSESIADFEVVVFVLSTESIEDEQVKMWVKEASDLNKTFIPVIIGGNFFTNWLLQRRYKGPNLRTSFLTLRKENNVSTFLKQLAGYGGSKVHGDVYGTEVEFHTDLDCKVYRNNEIIAESNTSCITKILLYKGTHRLTFQSKKYPDLTTDIDIVVKDLSHPLRMDVKIAKHRNVGKCEFADGFYEGSLFLDDRDGLGTFWFPNGDIYKGEWKDDIISGSGVMIYADGTRYEGNWSNGKRHGFGNLSWSNNTYEGNFVNDSIEGKGILKYTDGSWYDGNWQEGKYHGMGTKRFADGSKYVGDWVESVQHGHGIEYDPQGNVEYDGEWINGQKQTIFNKLKKWWNCL